MARPRKSPLSVRQKAGLDDARKESVQIILESLNPYLKDAAEVLGRAAKKGDEKAAATLIKFVADNAPSQPDNRALEVLGLIYQLRQANQGEEEELPEEIDIEAELERVTSNGHVGHEDENLSGESPESEEPSAQSDDP